MADFEVEVRKNSLKGPGDNQSIDLGAVARVRRLDGAYREASFAVGVGGAATRIDGLDRGLYEVQLHLPSGRILAQEIEVGSGATDRLVFDAGGSPRGDLGWQHFAGAVPSRGDADKLDAGIIGRANLGARAGSAALGLDRNFRGSGGPASAQDRPKLLLIETPATLEMAAPDLAKTLEVWRLLADGVQGKVRPVAMLKGFLCKRQLALDESDVHESWRFGFAPDNVAGKRPPRRFALVQCEGSSELVSLPLPWQVEGPAGHWRDEDYVDLLVDNSAQPRPVRASVMVRDRRYGGLLAYMNNGRLNLAGELLRQGNQVSHAARELLGEKARSPLGACAAAYVLLSTSSLDEARRAGWLGWIENLGNNARYSWIPDAALLCARIRLQTAQSASEAEAALPYIHRALRNGLPFYSLGLSWLLEAATHFRKQDPFIAQIFPAIDRVSRYLDVSQAFVVLKLDPAEA